MTPATGARRRAREVAFRVAYQADIAGDTYAQAWALRRENEERLSSDQRDMQWAMLAHQTQYSIDQSLTPQIVELPQGSSLQVSIAVCITTGTT